MPLAVEFEIKSLMLTVIIWIFFYTWWCGQHIVLPSYAILIERNYEDIHWRFKANAYID